ncbi:MAG: helix-turn-helix transcriptional regulator, partial [Oscillospiraceae bacterium]|nr:helix-turn-helix transcriptional regulator [Oscillospiraceae bacterium]
QALCLSVFRGCPKRLDIRSNSEFSTSHALSKIWRSHMSFDPNAIGNRIFTLRTNAKLSQEKLAEKLGVSHRHLGDLERGSSNGSVKILIDIAEYFHVSMDYLLLGRDPSRDQFQNELQAAIDHLEKIKGLL